MKGITAQSRIHSPGGGPMTMPANMCGLNSCAIGITPSDPGTTAPDTRGPRQARHTALPRQPLGKEQQGTSNAGLADVATNKALSDRVLPGNPSFAWFDTSLISRRTGARSCPLNRGKHGNRWSSDFEHDVVNDSYSHASDAACCRGVRWQRIGIL